MRDRGRSWWCTIPMGTRTGGRWKLPTRTYQVQRIDGLPPRQVTPSEQDLARIQADAKLIETAKARNSDGLGFTEEIAWPALGPISGIYGSQRILNGEPRTPHRGVDVAAPAGTPVEAMASGVVSLAEPDLYFTGGTVMIDHGHGLHSIYAHMQDVLVEVGQDVAQGAPLGTVGRHRPGHRTASALGHLLVRRGGGSRAPGRADAGFAWLSHRYDSPITIRVACRTWAPPPSS